MGKYCVIVKAVILFAVLTAAVTSCTPPGGGGGGDKYPQITLTHGAQDIISGTTQIDFGGVEENTSSDAFEFTIQNTGGADLSLTGLPLVQISGDDAAEFLLTQPGTGLLSPGASTTFGITFTPHSTGSKTADILISNNDNNNPDFSFSVTGTGTEEAAAPCAWEKRISAAGSDYAYDSIKTPGGNILLTGSTTSYGAGWSSAFVLELDAAGTLITDRTYGGPQTESARCIIATSDGGYLMVGQTTSYGADAGDNSNYDALAIKLNADFSVAWAMAYGKENTDECFNTVIETADGFVFGGYYNYTETDFESEGWLVKTDFVGAILWQNAYGLSGNSNQEEVTCLVETGDGYAAGGFKRDLNDFSRSWIFKVGKTDGNITWQRYYYKYLADSAKIHALIADDADNLIAAGTDGFEFIVFKIAAANGDTVWAANSAYYYDPAGFNFARAFDFKKTGDGNYVIAGVMTRAGSPSDDEFYVLKLDGNAGIVWQNSYGGADDETPYTVTIVNDDYYLLAGTVSPYNAGTPLTDIYALQVQADGDCGDLDTANSGTRSNTSFNVEDSAITPVDTSTQGAGATAITDLSVSTDNF